MLYGRSRQSIADIEQELHNIFNSHPQSHINDSGEPVIPADALVDVFRAFSEIYDGVQLMTDDEMDMLKGLLATNQGLEVTPQILLQFIAEKTKHSPHDSPHDSSNEDDTDLLLRAQGNESDPDANHSSHSSSSDSIESGGYARYPSRPPSRGLATPSSTKAPSPFDGSRRKRSTPLGHNAPSSWTKPIPAHRRKSDAGSRSDSESFSTGPSSFGRLPGRSRAPSNPTSPTISSAPLHSSSFPPLAPATREHSRAQSQPQSHFASSIYRHVHVDGHGSPLRMRSPATELDDDYTRSGDSFMHSVSSLQMPRAPSDSDSDNEEFSLGLVPDRSAASSTVSMEPQERLEALQRANTELGRKLVEAEQTLQNKLSEHELELEEMQSRLEEVRSELSATKREEKELRSKERQNITQMAALESEIGKLQKSLENARATYSSLQKQYQEQCGESERYRNTLRRRDQEIKDFQDAAALQAIESQKWSKEHGSYEERIQHLEADLALAQQAHLQLDEQKQENLMLKETIDRMRFDMDEMRSAMASAVMPGSSANSSAANSVSKSLGAELLGKMKGQWGMEEEDDDEVVVGPVDLAESEHLDSIADGGDSTDGEDFIQTIITRKTRKVPSRANKIETRTFEEIKEYSDAYTQHDISGFTSSRTTQTDSPPKIITTSSAIQTDEPRPTSVSTAGTNVEVQATERSSSSSLALLPPTPKSQADQPQHHPHSHDLPPAYNQISGQDPNDHDWLHAADTLKKWHKGAKIPFEGIHSGISEDAVEEWKTLKEELGIDCVVIDKIIATSPKTGLPRTAMGGRHAATRKSRFYNIYNTYVYGAGKDGATTFPTQFVLGIGATALMFLVMSPYMVPHYAVPGGPTYYDRTAWQSFNTMQVAGEGFSADGPAAVWSFLGRVGGGAARIARGWPT